jgi:hypothetical protein
VSDVTGARRTAPQSNDVGPASYRPDIFSFSTLARVVVFAVALMVPSSPKGLCEEFQRETMAMFVEQVLMTKDARSGGGTRAPSSFETFMLERVVSTDCDGQETSSP